MGERKVLNKYYPPDFDPDKLCSRGAIIRQLQNEGKRKRGARQMNVRMMVPFSMKCSACSEFIYIGTKFNSRVEKIKTEEYLGIPIWRFWGNCPSCRGEFSFKTDPKNTDYVLESGGIRTYDPNKDAERAHTSLKDSLFEELETDAMKALEHKTYSTANELQALEQLDELRKMNRRLLHQHNLLDRAVDWLDLTVKSERDGGVEEAEEIETLKRQKFERELSCDLAMTSRSIEKEKNEFQEERDKVFEGMHTTDKADQKLPTPVKNKNFESKIRVVKKKKILGLVEGYSSTSN